MILNRLKFALAAVLTGSSTTLATEPDIYDYVIIGSGPGGGSLAANLAREGHSVFLIEAGGDNHTSILEQLPALARTAAETPGHSWQFFVNHYDDFGSARRDPKYTYIQTNGSYYVGLDPPEGARPAGLYYPRGSTLGGSAQVNAMNFAWCPDNEWDHIANLTGDSSWGHEHMRRHLMNIENCTYVPEGTPGHGFDGYLVNDQSNATVNIGSPNVANFFSQMFRETEGIDVEDPAEMTELLLRDLNGLDPRRYENGRMYSTPVAIDPSTAARSGAGIYINQVIDAGHPLTVSFHSLATRVLTKQGRNMKPRAYGVEYMVGEGLYSADGRYDPEQTGEILEVHAKHEVIVSGGAFNTPQILMLSGIGPREELEPWDIPVVVDLPAVGSNLHDNYEVPVQIRGEENWLIPRESPCTGTFDDEDPCFVLWRDNASGPYAARDSSYGAVWRSSQSWDNDSDLMFLSSPGLSGLVGFYPGYSTGERAGNDPAEWMHAVVKMQTSNSAGTVRLNSSDPRIRPNINFNYFTESAERDLDAIVEGIELLRRAFDATGVAYTQLSPDPENLRQSIQDLAFSHHASSTCAIGADDDKKSCLDSRFRVRGVDNLRVVDASVFPRSPGGMPNGPTWTISRKAFETLLEDNH
ncbi:choline dehydrogenase [Fusarium oxysporum f. sp. phaseoli]